MPTICGKFGARQTHRTKAGCARIATAAERKNTMQRVTITIDDDLAAELGRFMAGHGHANRSEAVRDLSRSGCNRRNSGVRTRRAASPRSFISTITPSDEIKNDSDAQSRARTDTARLPHFVEGRDLKMPLRVT